MQLADQGLSQLLVIDVGKAETTADAGLTISHGLETNAFADTLEQGHQLVFIKSLRQVADVEANAHGSGETEKEGSDRRRNHAIATDS